MKSGGDNQFYHTDAITDEALPILSAFIDYLWRVVIDQPAGSVRPHIEREGLLNGLRMLLDSSLNIAWPLFLLAYGRTCCFLLTEADFPQSGPISWPASQGGLERGSLLGPQRGWPDVSPTHACYHWAWIIKGLCSNLCIPPHTVNNITSFSRTVWLTLQSCPIEDQIQCHVSLWHQALRLSETISTTYDNFQELFFKPERTYKVYMLFSWAYENCDPTVRTWHDFYIIVWKIILLFKFPWTLL